MITKQELEQLLADTESYRIERTTSTDNVDKFCQAICAFSNDTQENAQENTQEKSSGKKPGKNPEKTWKIEKSTQLHILLMIKSKPEITRNQLARLLNRSNDSIKYHLMQLVRKKIIKREGSNKSGKWIICHDLSFEDSDKSKSK